MLRFKYIGPHDEVEIPRLGLACKWGHEIEVSLEDGVRLSEQPDQWEHTAGQLPLPEPEPEPELATKSRKGAPKE